MTEQLKSDHCDSANLAGACCQHPVVIAYGAGVGRCESCGGLVLLPSPIVFSSGAVR